VRRPSEADVLRALDVLTNLQHGTLREADDCPRALRTIRAAIKPRPVWPAREVAQFLGVKPENLRPGGMRGFEEFPAPAQELPRPTSKNPHNTMRLWYVDEVQEFAAKRGLTERGGK
jgi:hypothetical protein